MLFLLEFIDMRWRIVLIDTSFSAKSLNVSQLVDSQNMLLIEWDTVELLASGERFSGSGVFDKCESICGQYMTLNP